MPVSWQLLLGEYGFSGWKFSTFTQPLKTLHTVIYVLHSLSYLCYGFCPETHRQKKVTVTNRCPVHPGVLPHSALQPQATLLHCISQVSWASGSPNTSDCAALHYPISLCGKGEARERGFFSWSDGRQWRLGGSLRATIYPLWATSWTALV